MVRLAAVSLAAALLLGACAPPPSAPQSSVLSPSTSPKRMTAAIMGDPYTLNSTMNFGGTVGSVRGVDEVERLVHAGLAIADNQGTLRPQLAEAVPTVENDLWRLFPDGRMEITWRIRTGVEWHDGAPLTAHDLAFSARVGQDKDLPMLGNIGYESVEGVEAVDDRTVKITWRRPYIEADTMFTKGPGRFAVPLPRHLLEKAYAEDKAGFPQHPYWTQEFVGLGPFKLRDWVGGSHLVLEANDRYVLGRPRIDEITVKFLLDPNTVIANVLAGTVELTMGRSASIEQATHIREQWREGRVDVAFEESAMSILPQHLNASPAIVGDVRFRRALVHATDRQQLVDTILGGVVPVADIGVAPNQPEYREILGRIARYEYDARKAAQLIEALGYARGSDGVFRDGAGQRLGVELRTLDGDDLRNKVILAVADHWQRAGVAVEPVIMPRQRQRDLEYRATFPGFEMVRASGSDLKELRIAAVPIPDNGYSGRNRSRYSNPELDALIERYFVTIAWKERMEVLQRIVHHITDQVVVMSLFYNTLPMMVGGRLQNVVVENIGWNAHEWDLKL